jgi:hypothetical protein
VKPLWSEPELPEVPFVDLRSGYILRAMDKFPKQAQRAPWRLHENYVKDMMLLRYGRNEYEDLAFTRLPRARPDRGEAA